MGRSAGQFSPSKTPLFSLPATLVANQLHFPLTALIDSGCELNLIDQALVEQRDIITVPLSSPRQVLALDGQSLRVITHRTEPLEVPYFSELSSPWPPVVTGS
ncbi:hypothetical protein XENORESO_005515 [Xenotaenia resolanae]|uniref:Peptidase A2 domain-containing protein n=1 Tax=Xenotaenia resolanae TaxID=208358 RepID=A0ABV0VV49_9TELE